MLIIACEYHYAEISHDLHKVLEVLEKKVDDLFRMSDKSIDTNSRTFTSEMGRVVLNFASVCGGSKFIDPVIEGMDSQAFTDMSKMLNSFKPQATKIYSVIQKVLPGGKGSIPPDDITSYVLEVLGNMDTADKVDESNEECDEDEDCGSLTDREDDMEWSNKAEADADADAEGKFTHNKRKCADRVNENSVISSSEVPIKKRKTTFVN